MPLPAIALDGGAFSVQFERDCQEAREGLGQPGEGAARVWDTAQGSKVQKSKSGQEEKVVASEHMGTTVSKVETRVFVCGREGLDFHG